MLMLAAGYGANAMTALRARNDKSKGPSRQPKRTQTTRSALTASSMMRGARPKQEKATTFVKPPIPEGDISRTPSKCAVSTIGGDRLDSTLFPDGSYFLVIGINDPGQNQVSHNLLGQYLTQYWCAMCWRTRVFVVLASSLTRQLHKSEKLWDLLKQSCRDANAHALFYSWQATA